MLFMNYRKFEIGTSSIDADRFEFMVRTIRNLGEFAAIAAKDVSKLGISYKDDGTAVTNLDLTINQIYIDEVRKRYGDDDVVIGEEVSGVIPENTSDKGIWLIDPLDGTGRLVRAALTGKYDDLAVTQLVSYFPPGQLRPSMSIAHNPFYNNQTQEVTSFGGRTYYQAQYMPTPRLATVRTDGPTSLADARRFEWNTQVNGRQDLKLMQKMMPEAVRMRLPLFLGSVALDHVDVAAFAGTAQPYDVAAGALAVHNAGGTVKTFSGEVFDSVDWRSPMNGIVAGASESLVDELIRRINNTTMQ